MTAGANNLSSEPQVWPSSQPLAPGMSGMMTGLSLAANANANVGATFTESNYEVFDPLNWMLDGLVEFPYNYNAAQGFDANGLGGLGPM